MEMAGLSAALARFVEDSEVTRKMTPDLFQTVRSGPRHRTVAPVPPREPLANSRLAWDHGWDRVPDSAAAF